MACCREVPEVSGAIEESSDPRLPFGQVLDGRFIIREVVGRSGMATIYRAEDLLYGRGEVAVKVPLSKIESDPAGFSRFRNEEEVGTRLCHPLLLRFLSVDGEKSRPYLVTEFLRGCTLDRLAAKHRPLPEADALKITSLVAEAVGFMHTWGYVHRDIKPGNVMICSDRTLRVLDFGLVAKPMRRRAFMAKLATPYGTPQYMAPEQVEQDLIDERTDIYCLGAVLYELLTGSTPLQDDDAWRSAFRRTTGDPVAPRLLNPALSPAAEEIVLHALQRKADDRYASMADFKADLDAPERVVVSGYSARLRPPRWKLSLHATPVAAGLLVGFGFLFLLVILFFVFRSLGAR